MKIARRALPALFLLTLPLSVSADEVPQLPLQLRLVAKKNVYKSDLTSGQLKKLVEAAEKGGKLPPAPAVDLTLEIVNRSHKEVSFWFKGDPVQVNLELKGPGAIAVTPRLAFTTIFMGPQSMKLAPGKSHTIPLSSLSHGFRGASKQVFWTDPGEYTLCASFNTGLSPAPKGLDRDETGFARVTLKSEPVKIKVEKK